MWMYTYTHNCAFFKRVVRPGPPLPVQFEPRPVIRMNECTNETMVYCLSV